MSYPILYNSTETDFADNGFGILSDAVSCVVTEERNGQFELQMQYPIDGIHYSDILEERILLAKPNPIDRAQPFRVYRSTTPLNGLVTFYARHISYDLSGIPANAFTAGSAADAMSKLSANAAIACPFDFWTDKTTVANMTVSVPAPIRSLLGGVQGSVLDVYGGEYKFDRYRVSLYNQRGADRGVYIRYGKNLLDLEQERNCANVYTGVYPYWQGTDGQLVTLPEKIVKAEETFAVEKAMMLDLSMDYENQPTETQLRERAQSYIKANNITVPTVSLTVSHAMLEQTEEYKGMALLERIELCDTVNIIFEKLGVSATAKAVSMTYNVLLERIESITFGDSRKTLIDGLNEQLSGIQSDIKQSARDNRSFLQKAIDDATSAITGNKGGYVVLHSTTGTNPDELLIMDTPDIKTAVNVWRWNKAGLGFSSSGYNGSYGVAITHDGKIVADYITAGTLSGNIIKAGRIQDSKSYNFWDLESGEFRLSAANTQVDSNSLSKYVGDAADSAADSALDSAKEYTDSAASDTLASANTYTDTSSKNTLESANDYADSAASDAVKAQTQKDIFDKLTDSGKIKGLYMDNNSLYVNADYIASGILQSRDGKTFFLDLENGIIRMDNGFVVNEDGSIEAPAGSFGGLHIVPGTEGAEITGAILLTIGSMRLQGNRITGLKITGENMLRDSGLMQPIQLLAAGSEGNFHALSLSDLRADLSTGRITYGGSGGGGGDPTRTVSGYSIRGTNWRIRDTPYRDAAIIAQVSEGYAYITIGQRGLGDGFTQVTAVYPANTAGNPSSCGQPTTYADGYAYISDDAIGSAVTITYR